MSAHRENFETLKRAFANNRAALLECTLKATGEKVAVICALSDVDNEKEIGFVPFAMFLNGNPYELLEPPERGLADAEHDLRHP